MTITEIINALRCCADSSTGCGGCPFVGKCIHTHADLKLAAIDAIKILCDELATYHAKSITDEKQIEDLQKQVNELIENETHSSVIKGMSRRIAELEKELAAYKAQKDKQLRDSLEKYEKKIEELRAQMPKQDKWMINIRWYQQPSQSATISGASQSATINVGTTFLCRSTGKLCPNATQYGYCKQTICTIDSARG